MAKAELNFGELGDTFPNPLTVLVDVGVSGNTYASATAQFPAGVFKTIKPISSQNYK